MKRGSEKFFKCFHVFKRAFQNVLYSCIYLLTRRCKRLIVSQPNKLEILGHEVLGGPLFGEKIFAALFWTLYESSAIFLWEVYGRVTFSVKKGSDPGFEPPHRNLC